MNKFLFSAASLAVTAAIFSSCSSDDKFIEENTGNEPLQVITMTVANSGDNFLGTRAASDRDLLSSDAKQSIENVHVVIYKLAGPNATTEEIEAAKYGKKTIVAHKLFTDWMNGGVSTAYNSHGREASWTLKSSDIIKDPGTYMAYAVGYNTTNYNKLNDFHALKSGDYDFPLDLDPAKQDDVKEIFAGSTVFNITNEKEGEGKPDAYTFNASLTLHRQVAGTIGYFANIPLMGNKDHETATGRFLRLVAADKSSNIVFAGFNSDFETTGNNVTFCVNGYMDKKGNAPAIAPTAKFYGASSNNAYTVYEVDLKEWFPELDSSGDGILNEGDTWKNAYAGKANVATGSVLAGKFIVPFLKVADKATFQLQMLDDSKNIIRYWNIRLPQGTTENPTAQLDKTITVVANDGSTTAVTGENVFNYSIVRNHLYNIGARNSGDTPGNPDDPTNPGDKPQDLNNETLIVKVNDNWEMINELDVD